MLGHRGEIILWEMRVSTHGPPMQLNGLEPGRGRANVSFSINYNISDSLVSAMTRNEFPAVLGCTQSLSLSLSLPPRPHIEYSKHSVTYDVLGEFTNDV